MEHRCQVTINFNIDLERAEAALAADPVYPRVLIEIPFNILGTGNDRELDLMIHEALISLKIEQPGIPEGTVFTKLQPKEGEVPGNGHNLSSAETSSMSPDIDPGDEAASQAM